MRNAAEAVLAARLARDCFGTDFIKLEIHPDPKYLLPDPIETLAATEVLAKEGFKVLPYIQADPVLCKRLEEVGTAAVMPLGAPIGTNKGLKTRDLLEIIIEESRVPVVIDAGLGLTSLVKDIIELSKLDEKSGELPFEQVDIYELAQDICQNLTLHAKKRNVHIFAEGKQAEIYGVRQDRKSVV